MLDSAGLVALKMAMQLWLGLSWRQLAQHAQCPGFNSQFCINWVWVHTYYSNIWGLKAEIKGHRRLHRELEACLGYGKP